jgi:outer membrane protein OmpA-like peptidoglycan-associated protein/tetratricopeptide (TPR) repeat protein
LLIAQFFWIYFDFFAEKVSFTLNPSPLSMLRFLFLGALIFALNNFSFGQKVTPFKLIQSGERSLKKLDYSPAVKSFKEALALDPGNKRALEAIVDIYLNKYQLYDSAAVYIDQQLQHLGEDTNYVVFYNYANCLRLREEHKEAIKQYNFFKRYGLRKMKPNHPIILEVDKNINYCINALNNQELIYEPFKVENMDFFVNSVEEEYTPVYLEQEDLLLYNARYKDYSSEQRDMDNLFFENIYYFDVEESVASTYNEDIEQKTHQCVVSYIPGSDSIIVFYQNKLWISTFSQDRLNNLLPLPTEFGSYYFQPHGVFSADKKTFVFSAKTEMGNLDLYVSRNINGVWSPPESISHKINSSEDEDGPFLSPDGKVLYFSSKGHNSSGGYDFYRSELIDGEWSIPQNLGYPMNSAGDDIYISWRSDERGGFFSSNRNGGFGAMDIYSFGLIKKTVRGTVKDNNGEFLSGVQVDIIDHELGPVATVTTNESGDFSFLVDPERKFEIKGSKEGYFEDANSLNTFGEDDIIISNLSLEKDPGISLYLFVQDAKTGDPLDSVMVTIQDNMIDVRDSTMTTETGSYHHPLPDKKLNERGSYNITLRKEGYLVVTLTYNVLFEKEGQYNVLEDLHVKMEKIEVGLDLTDVIDLNPIYFDYNKSIIRPDAAIELDKIVQVMNDNPEMVIELGSHTDARGSASGNMKLSDRRAKASAKYIQERITNPDRITGKGYGETKLVNECSDGVECSELQHQENRRTEFIIVKM